MCFNVEEMMIENRETSKIILKKNRRKKCKFLEKTKEKKKEEKRFREKGAVYVKGRKIVRLRASSNIQIITHTEITSTQDKVIFIFINRHIKNNHQQGNRGTEENSKRKS